MDNNSRPSKHIKKGPLSARQRNAIRMAFRWWADSVPRLNVDWRSATNFTYKGESPVVQSGVSIQGTLIFPSFIIIYVCS